jgi:hypothetical protein
MAAVLLRHGLTGTRPGWDYAIPFLVFLLGGILLDVPWPRQTLLRSPRLRQATFLLGAHVLLLAALATAYLHHPLAPFLAAGALLAHGGLWVKRRHALPPAFWLVSLALLASYAYLDAWWFAAIGDEYAFYDIAAMVIARHPDATISRELYNPVAVYGSHPGFSVLLQAASLSLFGDNVFGWRFSSIYLAAISLVFLHSFYRSFGRPHLAWIACALLAVSHYLMAFGKIGYNNLQALFAFSAALAAAAWVVRSRRRVASLACGVALALSLYVFPGALLTLPVPLLYLTSFDPPGRRSRGRWITLVVIFLAATLPMLLQPDFWATKWAGTLWNRPALADSWQAFTSHVLTNFAYAGMSFLFAPLESHFVAVGYLDVLSAAFVPLGLGVLLQPRSNHPARYLVASLCLLLLFVGSLHDYDVPTTTRMFLLLPWFVLLAAMGLVWLGHALRDVGWANIRSLRWTALLLSAILILNLVQAYPLSRLRMAARYQSAQVLLQREAHTLLDPGAQPTSLVILTSPEGPLRKSLLRQLRLHRAAFDPQRIIELPAAAVGDDVLADAHAIVLITSSVPEDTRAALEARLQAIGKSACRFRNSLGWVRLVVWAGPEEEARCAGAPIHW